jgi:hypothetical protein
MLEQMGGIGRGDLAGKEWKTVGVSLLDSPQLNRSRSVGYGGLDEYESVGQVEGVIPPTSLEKIRHWLDKNAPPSRPSDRELAERVVADSIVGTDLNEPNYVIRGE